MEEIQIKGDKNVRMKWSKRISSFILCMMLIVAMAFTITGCNGAAAKEEPAETEAEANVRTEGEEKGETGSEAGDEENPEGNNEADPEGNDEAEASVLGEGDTVFYVSVTDKEGAETEFEIHTDKETVGEALLDLGLIEGEDGEYGLYVKSVNGVTADYDKDGVYWAFYINGEYASTGVDATPVTEGEQYSFKVE